MCFEPTKDNTVVVIVEDAPPRVLSPVKREDLRRAAQRIYNAEGRVSIRALHRKYRDRIPGTLHKYGATIAYLLKTRKLRTRRFTR